MKESEIILHLLFPTNQQTTRAIDPGMAPFHYPTASTIAKDNLFVSFLFPSTADVRLVMTRQQFLIDRRGVVGGVQAEMLWLLFRGLGATDHQSAEGGTGQAHIMTIGS